MVLMYPELLLEQTGCAAPAAQQQVTVRYRRGVSSMWAVHTPITQHKRRVICSVSGSTSVSIEAVLHCGACSPLRAVRSPRATVSSDIVRSVSTGQVCARDACGCQRKRPAMPICRAHTLQSFTRKIDDVDVCSVHTEVWSVHEDQ